MKFLKSLLFAAAVGVLFSSQANAGFVFDISSIAVTPGSGIGNDANEAGGTLLGLVTTVAPPPAAVELSSPGDFYTFSAGTIQFAANETVITGPETDSVGYTVSLTFTSPLIGTVDLTLAGTAIPGPVSDSGVDYRLVSSPVHVFFGRGGEFEISINNLALTRGGVAGRQSIPVTITLDSAPVVPEPSSMALLGLGGLGMAFARYRKKFGVKI
jgi:hypothetical protein